MDIRNWPLGRIMQLPDWCFGQRYVVSCDAVCEAAGVTWDISEVAFPEIGVIWSVCWWPGTENYNNNYFRLAIGDALPINMPQMTEHEQLVKGLGLFVAGERRMQISRYCAVDLLQLRLIKRFGGRRLILENRATATAISEVTVAVVVSSIPTEVPDWLCSGRV